MSDLRNTSVEDFIAESRKLAASPVPGTSLSFPELGGVDVMREKYTKDTHVQLGRLSVTHEAIMDWLLTNPGKGQMKRCAEFFGFTRAWLSSMIWSDAFQAKLADRKDELFKNTVIPMRDQMNGVAQRGLERLGEKIELIEDPKVLSDVTDKLLHRLGYAPKVGTNSDSSTNNTQNNTYFVSPDLLAAARENAKKGDLHNGATCLPSPEGVQALPGNSVGGAAVLSAPVRCEEAQDEEARS